MDLIFMDKERRDLGVLKDYDLDLAFGISENNFECTVAENNHCCQGGYFLYIEGTEYGGIIDEIKVNTEQKEIVYKGRTWHGILESKIIEPDAGENYLVLKGEANAILALLIERLKLGDLFRASTADSGIFVKYQMNRYIGSYNGIRKMLKESGAKLHTSFNKGMVELSAVPLVDYSKDEQFDTDQIDFVITKNYAPVNHVICLGKGELAEREVIHVYADATGNISDTQVFTGLQEVTKTYDYSNAESTEDLKQGGIDIIRESWNSNEVAMDFDSNDTVYDIGDIVGAKERITEIEVAADITKKIVAISGKCTTIQYKVGE